MTAGSAIRRSSVDDYDAAVGGIDARIDRLPSSRPVWSWVARVSFGGFFEIYEVALTGVMAPLLVQAGIFRRHDGFFGMPDLATFAFATFAGLFVGVLAFSAVADRYGRRPIFTFSLVAYAVATLAMAMQDTALAICVCRFVAAVGVGAEVVAIDSYLAELIPKRMRGRGFAVSKALQYSAVPIAAGLAALAARGSLGGIDGWRLVLFVPTIGAVLVWWVRRDLPESPRWLARHGRLIEAERVTCLIEDAVRLGGRTLIETDPSAARTRRATYSDLVTGWARRRVVMMIVAGCSSSIAYYGFSNWLPTMIEARGAATTSSLFYTSIIALAYPLAPLAFAVFADRFERKWQIVAGAGLTAATGLAFSVQTGPTGWVVFGLLVAIGGNLMAYASHTYRSELFPTEVRARAIGLIYACDRLVAAFSAYIVAWLLLRFGVGGVLGFVTAAALIDMVVIGVFGPRTRALASEEMRRS